MSGWNEFAIYFHIHFLFTCAFSINTKYIHMYVYIYISASHFLFHLFLASSWIKNPILMLVLLEVILLRQHTSILCVSVLPYICMLSHTHTHTLAHTWLQTYFCIHTHTFYNKIVSLFIITEILEKQASMKEGRFIIWC